MAKVCFTIGDDVSTDAIYPGRFMATVLPSETPAFAFADQKEFNAALNKQEIAPGSIIVGGENFGCGSSREQAASCLKGHGLIIVARSFARIFLQNGVNLGLQMISAAGVEASVGDDIEIEGTKLTNRTTGKTYDIQPQAPARQAIIDAGGLIPYARKKLVQERGARA